MALLSPTLSRIYTPPTCTLEVTAQPSALSRWTRTPAIKSLDFLLSLDGLQSNRREPLEIRGDQTQLAHLSETVSDYIQQLLARPHTDLPLNASTAPSSPSPSAPLQLQPRTLLTHELILGDLATEQSGPSVVLKVSQLYDLATALEDCAADLQQIPTVVSAPLPWRTALLPIAQRAAVVLLTVGLGTATWRLLQSGPIVLNQAERSPRSKTALAPAAPPSTQKPSPPSAKLKPSPLVLPKVKLPTRSSNPLTNNLTKQENNDKKTDIFGTSRPPTASSSQTMQKLPPEPGNLGPQQEIALAPASTAQSSSVENRRQAADSAVPPPASVVPPPASTIPGMGATQSEFSGMSRTAPNNTLSQKTLFDTAPQIAEVRDYVANRWQLSPPPSKTLEYRVTVNANGSLAKVEPLGVSAQQYLQKVPLPSGQTPFVSPLESGALPPIRLVLYQDGTVKTFLDPSAP